MTDVERGVIVYRSLDGSEKPLFFPIPLWEKGKPFNLASIDAAMGAEASSLKHLSFGEGFSWRIGPEDPVVREVEIFPDSAVATTCLIDELGSFQKRQYVVDSIFYELSSFGEGIRITSRQDGFLTNVHVYSNGNFQEQRTRERPIK